MSKKGLSNLYHNQPQSTAYFAKYETVQPPVTRAFSKRRENLWQFFAVFTIGLGFWYLAWRWTQSLNPDALVFSIAVALAETALFLGTLLFFHDIWAQADTPSSPAETTAIALGLDHDGAPSVDIFVATYDESSEILRATLADAVAVRPPNGWSMHIFLLDDGNRPWVRDLATEFGVQYFTRTTNTGFKAGNLKNALLRTTGDFVVICDADTRLFPNFLKNTLGYFRDQTVAWVQTPHWFYDVPEGELIVDRLPKRLRFWGRFCEFCIGRKTTGHDPFMSGSQMFFDVIQRRRNRNGASFCCGAGSIHRRSAIFSDALGQHRKDRQVLAAGAVRSIGAAACALQPFRFHVSEDIYSSMKLHSAFGRWRSVYHPNIEARMLSPWSMEAWAAQKLKYAAGTLDLFGRDNPLFSPGMPWRIKLHYAATFWSYVSSLFLLVLLVAPVVTLFTGAAPVEAYSLAFFLHLLPLLLANEIALALGTNGHDGNQGRILSVATLPTTLTAMFQVIQGRRPGFKPTPKTPIFKGALRFVLPHIAGLAVMMGAAIFGIVTWARGSADHTAALMVVNLFWLIWNGAALAQPVIAAFWSPPDRALLQSNPAQETLNDRVV